MIVTSATEPAVIFGEIMANVSSSDFLDDLHDVFIVEDVVFADFLGLMFDRRAPDQSAEKLRKKISL